MLKWAFLVYPVLAYNRGIRSTHFLPYWSTVLKDAQLPRSCGKMDGLFELMDLYAMILFQQAKILYQELLVANSSTPTGIWRNDYHVRTWDMWNSTLGNYGPMFAGPPINRGVYLADPTRWGSWAHHGHRLWAYMSEEFWLYEFKVQRCPQPWSHDWTACPYAHKGERARRRDPRRFSYIAMSCPDYRESSPRSGGQPSCGRGLKCRYAHGVFELWLHPDRFRTRMCEAGLLCPRPICFFAHFAAELRGEAGAAMPVLPQSPPRIVQRLASPELTVSACQFDLTAQEIMMARLSLNSDAGASSSSSAAAVVAAPGSTSVASPDGGEPEACACCPSAAVVEDEDSLYADYPHLDLILDLLK